MQFGLKESVIDRVTAVLGRYPQVKQAILYGSRAKGNFKPGSDIDLTLVGEELGLSTLYRIMDDIDDLLLPYSFDISLYSQINDPDLRDHIRRVGAPLYQSDSALTGQTAQSLHPKSG
jgi:uncharacterized protein